MPISMIDGEPIDIEAGPNWDDDLSGSPVYAENDPNLKALTEEQRQQLSSIERLVFFYFPRICNHCLNPACVASCPSGALYKRGEDGIVLIDQKVCRAWRSCVAACPYKKTYFNWKTGKSEKCILCFPRLETGQAPACFHSCVGRIRYLGILLYDADQDRRDRKRSGRPTGRGPPITDSRPERSGSDSRGQTERDPRVRHGIGPPVTGLSLCQRLEDCAAAAHRIPNDANVVLRSAAATGHLQSRERHGHHGLR